jgi:hypothetical protein
MNWYSHGVDGWIGGVASTYAYDRVGRRDTLTRANGAVTNYTCDGADRLTALQTRVGNTTTSRFPYTLDRMGRRTGITETLLLGPAHRYRHGNARADGHAHTDGHAHAHADFQHVVDLSDDPEVQDRAWGVLRGRSWIPMPTRPETGRRTDTAGP